MSIIPVRPAAFFNDGSVADLCMSVLKILKRDGSVFLIEEGAPDKQFQRI